MRKLCAVSLAVALSTVPVAAADLDAKIETFQFMPKSITVDAGSTVTWTNRDGIEHSVTADLMTGGAPAFDSGLFKKGESRALTFAEKGTFSFHCARHTSMTGEITVK